MSRFAFYHDAALTLPVSGANPLVCRRNSAGTVDASCYLGEPADGYVLEDATNPGVDPNVVSIADLVAAAGVEPTDIVLALSQAELATNIAGADLEIGAQVFSLAANAVEIWLRVDNQALAAGGSDIGNLSIYLLSSDWREAA